MHIDPAALDRTLRHLRETDTRKITVEAALQQVVDATQRLFSVTGAGLMFIDEHEVMRYVASSDEPGRILEKAQEQMGVGPCVDALVHDLDIRTFDIATDERYEPIAPLVLPHGVRAVLGVPVHLDGTAIGSLNVYRDEPHQWSDDDIAALQSFCELIEAIIGGAVLAHRSSAVVHQLEYALQNRVTIERAVGVIMGRHGVDAVTAFNLLRDEARAARRKVADIADEILEATGRP